MNKTDVIAVTSRSFSCHPGLASELRSRYENVILNEEGLLLEGEELVKFLAPASKAIVALNQINESVLKDLPNLKLISKYGVGLNNIDFETCEKFNLPVRYASGVNKRSVAELTLTNMLMLIRRIPQALDWKSSGKWSPVKGNQLTEKRVGIIGMGNIGQEMIKLLAPFSCEISYFDILDFPELGLPKVSIKEMFKKCDIVSIHVPLDKSTENLVNKSHFEGANKNVILINTARGGIVNELDLYNFLRSNPSAFAGFDVFASEPPGKTPLIELNNFFSTPHIGGSAKEAILAMGMAAIANLED